MEGIGEQAIYGIGHDRHNSSREFVVMGSEDTGLSSVL